MRNLFFLALTITVSVIPAFAQKEMGNLAFVKGGPFKNPKCTNYYGKNITLSDFYIGKYEVSQKEWTEIMGSNPSYFQGDNLPVETVSWYDCVEYCNKRSAKEGLKPYYAIDRNRKDTNNQTVVDAIKWTVMINAGADGYRLPTEAEWEYAASGGQLSKGYTYSGGNDVIRAAWFWQNSGDTNLIGFWTWPRVQENHDRTHPVDSKEPNELGLYNMSGNVREWCGDWGGDLDANGNGPKASSAETGRAWKGGCWMGGDFCCEVSFRANFEASGKGPDQGFRVCRSQQ
ncbi:MAG TPA: SUMF1/EgtB/PvdO family nonheme iron enzyme [Verrucomicrobiae bacterium]|nr:SUMF1/EgtB/PvdO family nonheme iron enzyme [Verrucomicrobiae bacterium]